MASFKFLLVVFFLLAVKDVQLQRVPVPAVSVVPSAVPRTCGEVQSHFSGDKFKEGVYTIDPDGPGGEDPFQVTCTTRGDLSGQGVTLITHQGGETPRPINFYDEGRHTHDIRFTYKPTLAQIESLIKVSSKCRQFVQLHCHHAYNFHSGSDHWWVSRQGWNMTNWGGAPTNSSQCACGVQGRCDKSGRDCNCNINDYEWRSDEGYLDDKRYLPVKQVSVRDVDGEEEIASLMVKPMECYGGLINGQATERCQCSLHAEEKASTTTGPLLLQLPDLVYGQSRDDLWIDDGIRNQKITDVYPTFFKSKKRRQLFPCNNVNTGVTPECSNVLQRCPKDCERLAKLKLASMSLSSKVLSGGAMKPLGQVMCENAGAKLPSPGRRIVAFYKTATACGSVHSSTHVFPDALTLCCHKFTLPFSNQPYNVFNENCTANVNLNSFIGQ